VSLLMVFALGISELAACAEKDEHVTLSSRRLFQQSTMSLKWERKSTPMIGYVMSVTMNRHMK
jgi:hypothetical protein